MCEPNAGDHLLDLGLILQYVRLDQRYFVQLIVDGCREILQGGGQGLQGLCGQTFLLLQLERKTLVLSLPLLQLSLIKDNIEHPVLVVRERPTCILSTSSCRKSISLPRGWADLVSVWIELFSLFTSLRVASRSLARVDSPIPFSLS